MKAVFAVAVGVGFAAAVPQEVHQERSAQIRNITQRQGVLWQAAANPRFSSQAPGASKSLCGVKGSWKEAIHAAVERGEIQVFEPMENDAIPDDFDSQANWPSCAQILGDIRDQSDCGCCWAFAAAEAASDRMCIATDGKLQMPLSAEDVCFCASDDGCSGGDISSPWSYIKDSGAVTGGQYQGSGPMGKGFCADFSLPHCHHHGPQGKDPYPAEGAPGCPAASSPQCPSACDAEAAGEHKAFLQDKYSFQGEVETASGEEQIQRMVMAGGPVETAFTVYSDFENYAGGIYHHVTGEQAGGHAVKMVGWGVEGGNKYWKIANSWNPWWGESGYFRIRRGVNEGGIEDMVTGASHAATWSKKSSLASTVVV